MKRCFTFGLLAALAVVGGVVLAQTEGEVLYDAPTFDVVSVGGKQVVVPDAPATFSNGRVVLEELCNPANRGRVRSVLRAILTQDQADTLVEALTPVLTTQERISFLERAEDAAIKAGEQAIAHAINLRIKTLEE